MRNFKRKYYFFLVFSSIVLFSNCRKDIEVPKPEFENIFGKWEWVKSTGGMDGGTISPSTTNYTITLEFNKNGIYREFKNDKKTVKLKFKFSQDTWGSNSSTSYDIIDFEYTGFNYKDPDWDPAILSVSQDSLVLWDLAYDGYTRTYCKIK